MCLGNVITPQIPHHPVCCNHVKGGGADQTTVAGVKRCVECHLIARCATCLQTHVWMLSQTVCSGGPEGLWHWCQVQAQHLMCWYLTNGCSPFKTPSVLIGMIGTGPGGFLALCVARGLLCSCPWLLLYCDSNYCIRIVLLRVGAAWRPFQLPDKAGGCCCLLQSVQMV